MTGTASETGREGLVDHAASQVQSAAASAQEKAVELKQQGRSKLGESLDERTNQAGGQARKMAQVLRQSGGQLREEGQGEQVASLAEGAAEQVERLGSYLEQSSGNELLRDVEQFARRRPWIVAGFGLLAGLAGSRFLKASSERRYGSGQGTGDLVGRSPATVSPRAYGGEPIGSASYGTSG
jgi:ElaB/YqjD/DUF883 family membrane-anchored ribosome-binding protein